MTMEVLAGLGLMATELFKYNRENYEFDQDQRFEREECRLKMQIERFALFREDIRDLVELTVGKMDLYHLIGALFLKQIVLYYCVGFFETPPPPFLLTLYYLSNACAWVYLMLAIWLAMHASIASHSYGTRLLTRFVRLPIPGNAQLNVLNARMGDFEKQGMSRFRIPFIGGNNQGWNQRDVNDEVVKPGQQADSRSAKAAKRGESLLSFGSRSGSQLRSGSTETGHIGEDAGKTQAGGEDWLDEGEYAFGGAEDLMGREQEMLRAVEFRTHKHVQLFRKLQSQWQCFDAYARVAMSLGVRQMIQSLTYYLIGICMVDQQAPYVAYMLVIALQTLGISISILDIHSLPCCGNLDLSIVGLAPTVIAVVQLTIAPRNPEGFLRPENQYYLSLLCFPLELVWTHMLLWAASPTDKSQSLPRHFRAVLFMDVFSEVDDPMEMDPNTGKHTLTEVEQNKLLYRVEGAERGLEEANAALRRWEATQRSWRNREQQRVLKQAAKELDWWVDALVRELEVRKLDPLHEELRHRRPWEETGQREREEDVFAGCLVGPFTQFTGMGADATYWWDPEREEFLYEPLPANRARNLLRIGRVVDQVGHFREEVEVVCGGGEALAHEPDASDDDENAEGQNAPFKRAVSQSSLTSARRQSLKEKQSDDLRTNRVPWQLMAFLSRSIQLVWLGIFVISVLRAMDVFTVDCQASGFEGCPKLGRDEGSRWPLPGEKEGVEAGLVEGHHEGHHSHEGETEATEATTTTWAPALLTVPPAPAPLPIMLPVMTPGAPEGALEGHTTEVDEHGTAHDRRLGRRSFPARWRFDLANVSWPGGRFFRMESMACLAGVSSKTSSASSDLLLGTPFAMYGADATKHSWGLEELPAASFPVGATPLCGSASVSNADTEHTAGHASCMLGAPAPGGLQFWPMGQDRSGEDARFFRLEGAPWQRMAGAVVSCDQSSASEHPEEATSRCLLLVGWPGGPELSAALIPMPLPPPEAEATIVPHLSIPLPGRPGGKGQRAPAVAGLHVEPSQGNLWVLAADGELRAWALFPGLPRLLGHWRVEAPEPLEQAPEPFEQEEAGTFFEHSAVCVRASSGDLLVAGRYTAASGASGGPALLTARLPRALRMA